MFRYTKWALLFFSLASCGSHDNLIAEGQASSHVSPVETQGFSRENCRRIEWEAKLHFVDDDLFGDDIDDYEDSGGAVICNDNGGHRFKDVRYEQKHGNEMRGDIYFSFKYKEDGSIYLWGSVWMYEGWTTDTDDLDGTGKAGKLIHRGRDSGKIRIQVLSGEINDFSSIDCEIRIKIKKW